MQRGMLSIMTTMVKWPIGSAPRRCGRRCAERVRCTHNRHGAWTSGGWCGRRSARSPCAAKRGNSAFQHPFPAARPVWWTSNPGTGESHGFVREGASATRTSARDKAVGRTYVDVAMGISRQQMERPGPAVLRDGGGPGPPAWRPFAHRYTGADGRVDTGPPGRMRPAVVPSACREAVFASRPTGWLARPRFTCDSRDLLTFRRGRLARSAQVFGGGRGGGHIEIPKRCRAAGGAARGVDGQRTTTRPPGKVSA